VGFSSPGGSGLLRPMGFVRAKDIGGLMVGWPTQIAKGWPGQARHRLPHEGWSLLTFVQQGEWF